MLNPYEYNNTVLRIKERKRVIRELSILLQDEAHVRGGARNAQDFHTLSNGTKINLNLGICSYHSSGGVEVTAFTYRSKRHKAFIFSGGTPI